MPQVVSLQRSVGTLGKPLLLLSKYFNGLLDNVRLWNVARTGVQLQGSMHASLGAGVAGLLFSYVCVCASVWNCGCLLPTTER